MPFFQILLLILLGLAVLVFLYFFMAANERRRRNEKRKFQSAVSFSPHLTENPTQPRRLFKKDPQDPLLIFVYWVILPLFCAGVTVALVLLGRTMF